MDQQGRVANPARGQLNKESVISLSAFATENLVSRYGSAVPSRASLLISILRLNMVLSYGIPSDIRGGVHYLFKPPYTIGSVPSLSGHAIAYQ